MEDPRGFLGGDVLPIDNYHFKPLQRVPEWSWFDSAVPDTRVCAELRHAVSPAISEDIRSDTGGGPGC